MGTAYDWILANVGHQGDDCLTFPYCLPNGYGNVSVGGKTKYAHRLMCEIIHGAPPTLQHYATHSCGNGHRGCVNPKHLRWKTPSENQLERAEHGRWTGPKLSYEQKLIIRDLQGLVSQEELALRFGVHRTAISKVIIRRSWENGRGADEPSRPTGDDRQFGQTRMNYFTSAEDAEILRLAREGKNYSQISRIIGRSSSSIGRRAEKLGAPMNYKPWPKGTDTKTLDRT